MRNSECVIFIRTSGQVSTEQHQLNTCMEYAEYYQMKVKGVFRDHCSSTALKSSEQIKAMLDFIKHNKIQYVVIASSDRLARKWTDAAYINGLIESKGSYVRVAQATGLLENESGLIYGLLTDFFAVNQSHKPKVSN